MIAVSLVLVYHFFPEALPGGFLGVDIFFVISGFLITSLLLREKDRHGRISLSGFWRRRARRLLPALALVMGVSTVFALIAAAQGGRDLLVNIGAQMLGAFAFVSNWVYVALGGDYFTRDNPELFRNTWSLSIEEQFYVVLPLLLLLTLRAHSRLTRSLLFILLAAGSAGLMTFYATQGVPATRVYFGSDSHVFGLFGGVSLAVLMHPLAARLPAPRGPLPAAAQLALAACALAGLGLIGWLSLTLAEGGSESFAWGFQLASAAALLVVWAVTRPGAWIGRWLDCRPMRWIGERSYGIYLWHWPLLLLLPVMWGGGSAPAEGSAGAAVALAATALLTFLFAALSYRYVEQPVRRHGVRGSFRLLGRAWAAGGERRAAAFAITVSLALGAAAVTVAVTIAPARSSAAEAIERGRVAMLAQHQSDLATAARERGIPGVVDGLDGNVTPHTGPPVSDRTIVPLNVPPGTRIFGLGDSVMLASLPELQAAFPGIRVDAAVSRGLGAGVEIMAQLSSQQSLRPVLVVGLGTNGPVEESQLDEMLDIADGRQIVLVNAHAERDWIPGVNTTLKRFAQQHRGVVLADWNAAITPHPDRLAGDGIHPGPSGGKVYAKAVRSALISLQSSDEQPLR